MRTSAYRELFLRVAAPSFVLMACLTHADRYGDGDES